MNLSCRELYIVLNSPVQVSGGIAEVYILGDCIATETIDIEIRDHKGIIKRFENKTGQGNSILYAFEFQVPRIPGKYELILKSQGSVRDKIQYLVVSDDLHRDRYLSFVWHNHQAPNYLPDGRFYFPWAFIHTYSDELSPYGKGPYNYHALILNKYRDYKATYNLSPSLLAQWIILLEHGVRFRDGSYVSPRSPESKIVEETLNHYRDAARRGQIDVLTSIYAHTIAGFIIEFLGASDVIIEELAYGIDVTKRTMGIEPVGVWTPEMAFSMRLVDIYSDLGLRYTILDAKCHLERAEGDIGSIHEPYNARGSRGEIVVFFRDTELSNILSFQNDFKSYIHAWRQAYDYAYKVSLRLINGGILVVALDGENWMIFARNPPLTAVFYDKLVEYILRIQELGYLRTANLREIVDKLQPRRVITRIPTTSWLCSFAKWNGEIKDHSSYWEKARKYYDLIKRYEQTHGPDDKSRKARWALWHALDSDYWWAEFWAPELIDTWLCEVESILESKPAQCIQTSMKTKASK